MSQYGDWQEAQTGQMEMWDHGGVPGTTHEGVYTGERTLDPQYPPVYIIGDKLVRANDQIKKVVSALPIGSLVRIVYQSTEKRGGGKKLHHYAIKFALPQGGAAKSPAPPKPAEADDDEVPF